MPPITTEDVVCHLLGQSSLEISAAIEQQAEADEDFAAQLSLLSACIHPTSGETTDVAKHIPVEPVLPRAPRRQLARWVAIVFAALFSMGMAWAGWELIREKPLLEDNFTANWGDRELWSTPRRVVKVESGHVRLFDRGSLCTTGEFTAPYKLQFRWLWNDLAGDFLYRDILTVTLRTSGNHRKEHAYEILDGITIVINATSGQVNIHRAEERPTKLLLSRVLKLAPQVWYDVTILDRGDHIDVFIAGENLAKSEVPLLSYQVEGTFDHGHISFFNRERVADASFESWIDDVVVTKLKN